MKQFFLIVTLMLTGAPALAQDAANDAILEYFQEIEERLAALESENELLKAIVSDLERIVNELRSPSGTTRPDITAGVEGRPTFIVEEVRRFDPDQERVRLGEIEKEITATETEVAEATKKISANRARRSGTGLGQEEVNRLTLVVSRGKRAIYKLNAESARIRREMEVPRFWLLGWDGELDIMLLTTRDDAELMRVLRAEDQVQWVGKVVDSAMIDGKQYQTIVADLVWRLSAQVEIAPRPKDRTAVWTPLITQTTSAKSTPLPRLPASPGK